MELELARTKAALHNTQSQLAALQSEHAALQSEQAALKSEHSRVKQENEELSHDKEALEQEISDLQRQVRTQQWQQTWAWPFFSVCLFGFTWISYITGYCGGVTVTVERQTQDAELLGQLEEQQPITKMTMACWRTRRTRVTAGSIQDLDAQTAQTTTEPLALTEGTEAHSVEPAEPPALEGGSQALTVIERYVE